jgi:hypothetical protein
MSFKEFSSTHSAPPKVKPGSESTGGPQSARVAKQPDKAPAEVAPRSKP